MKNNILHEISNMVNKLKVALQKLRENEVKWILVIPCWILEIQILLFQYIDPIKFKMNRRKEQHESKIV